MRGRPVGPAPFCLTGLPTPDDNAGLRIEGLQHSYGEDLVLALDSWTLPRGARCLVQGASGSGKSTLLHILAGLIVPSSGQIEVAGVEVSALAPAARDRFRARHIGLVPQKLHLIGAITVADNLRLARRLAGRANDEAALQRLLARLDLDDLADRRPDRLSQGQAQRVAIARALINQPALLLADEPTAALDDDNAAAAVALLRQAADLHQSTLVVATHDNRIGAQFDERLSLDPAGIGA